MNQRRSILLLSIACLLLTPIGLLAQQRPDSSFIPTVASAAFDVASGPLVAIDAAHHNFHTLNGHYATLAALLEADGFRVQAWATPFTTDSLAEIDILVIANAGSDDQSSWVLPTASAFLEEEASAIEAWVEQGGSLLLIADHMPAAGAAAALASRFGIHFTNGYTYQPREKGLTGDLFTRQEGLLRDHPFTRGRHQDERIDTVMTFTGQGFQASSEVDTVLVFGPGAVTFLPVDAEAAFSAQTPRVHSGGWLHGATVHRGQGRVAFFGEAAMFSAQVAGPKRRPMGMNHPKARQNKQFALNVFRWLAGLLDER